MRILVTGASGLLGLNLAVEASNLPEYQVTGQVYSNRISSSAFSVVQADLRDPDEVERIIDLIQPDYVINCAALAIVDACESDPVQAQKLNIELPQKLASYVARGGARLLHVSTDAVFDGQCGNYTEDDTPNPISVYGQTKLDGEYAVMSVNPEAIIARVNFYGWSLTGERSLSEFFFYNLMSGNQIMGFTDIYFCPLLVNQLAHIFLNMLELKLSGLYHVVSSECISKYNFGMRIAGTFELDETLITAKSVMESGLQAARSPKLTLSTTKLAIDLGKIPPTINDGLQEFHRLYQQGYPDRLRRMGNI